MTHTALGIALVIALTYHFIFSIDYAIGWQTLARPIVAAPIMGLILGDLRTGVIMGASLEAIYMGISGIGGSYPADTVAGAVLSVAFVVISGVEMEAALALSLPIGTALAAVKNLMMPVYAFVAGYFSRLADKGDDKAFGRAHIFCNFIVKGGAQTLILFLCMAFGLEHVQELLNILPAFILKGLSAAGGMLPAVGFGILLSMIWSKELGAYFFVGFILVKYLGLPTVAIAIIAGVIAVLGYFRDTELKKIKAAQIVQTVETDDKEDFFA